MKIKRILFAFTLGCSVGLLADVRIETAGQTSMQISFGVGEAAALPARRVARRTARRTSRRVYRRHVILPSSKSSKNWKASRNIT